MAKRIVTGIVAHVDAGKTTLSEALLYRSGELRRLGRVDHGDAFLDTETLEKQRGITIHAHQARVMVGDLELTLLDTPGHVDFAAETERVLGVLDYAILVVSGTAGVQGHTETLWRLLNRYQVPTIIFVNKCDADGFDRDAVLTDLRSRLSDSIYPLPSPVSAPSAKPNASPSALSASSTETAQPTSPFAPSARGLSAQPSVLPSAPSTSSTETAQSASSSAPSARGLSAQPTGGETPTPYLEDIATLDESAADEYLSTGTLSFPTLRQMIASRTLFPVFFGSALRLTGIDEFLAALDTYISEPQYPPEFGLRAYKISHDDQHNRLTWVKVTGGVLKAKAILDDNEKVDQIRVYNGAKFEIAQEIPAGGICALTGPEHTFPGQGMGRESDSGAPSLQPVLTYTVLPPGADSSGSGTSATDGAIGATGTSEAGSRSGKSGKGKAESEAEPSADSSAAASRPKFDDLTLHRLLTALRELEDEEPLLHVAWVERLGEIHVQLMGAVQLEIIQSMLADRFGLEVAFGPGGILYRETITEPIEGVGHFEPLRHYAEAHILLEPGEPGSGIEIASAVPLDELERNWQRLIMTHMREKEHLGVLVGAPLTDVKMTLVAARAHLKHTEGGDFRQATYRAIRQGLMELKAGVSGHPSAEQIAQGPAWDEADGTDDVGTAENPRGSAAGAGAGAAAKNSRGSRVSAGSASDVRAGATGSAAAASPAVGNCRVLEPWYRYRLEVPADMLGRAMADVQRMAGTFEPHDSDGDYAVLEGTCPVSEMRDYAMTVNAYTHGRGRLTVSFGGYHPCHDEARVVAEAHYDPESDLDNTPDSVFCAHGAGYPVKWYKVPDFMHLGWATE